MQPLSLYVHIPFCRHKCHYCDFNTYAGLDHLIPPYLAALEQELDNWAGLLTEWEVRTIFFGGGTPSLPFAGASRGFPCPLPRAPLPSLPMQRSLWRPTLAR